LESPKLVIKKHPSSQIPFELPNLVIRVTQITEYLVIRRLFGSPE
jgi:hypothetical protein